MDFRREGARRALLLPPRSLLIMADEARLAWAHYIPHHKADWVGGSLHPRERRVSLTFRQVGMVLELLTPRALSDLFLLHQHSCRTCQCSSTESCR